MIYYVRHGQTPCNVNRIINDDNNVDLTQVGREQAQAIAKQLRNVKFDIVFCSPYTRTRSTCNIINQYHKNEIIIDERLKERVYGNFSGKTYQQLNGGIHYDFSMSSDDSTLENLYDFKDRVFGFIDEILAKCKGKNILIVAHGGVSIIFEIYFKHLKISGEMKRYEMAHDEIRQYLN